jgi:putative hydrolase of the HAD superfamily
LTAVIFDLGGTLIDYLGGAASWPAMEIPGVQALYGCLAAAGFPIEAEVFCDGFVRSIELHWRAAIDGAGDPPTLASLVEEVCAAAGFGLTDELRQAAVAAYCAPIAERAAVGEGAADVMVWLRDRGIRIGLISNTVWPADAHRRDLERYGLLHHFDAMLFSSETGLWKPDPRVFQRALEAVGARADQAVYVGDQLAEDIGGAHRAGLRAILYGELPQNVERREITEFRPDAQISALSELPEVLLSF